MPKLKPKLITKIVRINEQQQDLLDDFIERWGFASESEVFRHALYHYHKELDIPDYKKSMKQTEKESKAREQSKIDNMPDEEYATEIMGARVFKAADGKKHAVLMSIANRIRIFPLEQIKEVDSQDSFFRETHQKMLAEGADFDLYLERGRRSLEAVGITLPDKG